METTFTNVFYEDSKPAADERLNKLRQTDKYPEVKAYIIQEKDGSWRVLRRIKLTLNTQPSNPLEACKKMLQARLKQKKTGH